MSQSLNSVFILSQCSKSFVRFLKHMPGGSHHRNISDKDTTFLQNVSHYLPTDMA
jgi:hypothetical protein